MTDRLIFVQTAYANGSEVHAHVRNQKGSDGTSDIIVLETGPQHVHATVGLLRQIRDEINRWFDSPDGRRIAREADGLPAKPAAAAVSSELAAV